MAAEVLWSIGLFIIVHVSSTVAFGYMLRQPRAGLAPKESQLFRLNIPSTGKERNELLKEDSSGVFFERIKEAARMKVERPRRSLIDRMFRRAWLWLPAERRDFLCKAYVVHLIVTVAAAGVAYSITPAATLYAASVGSVGSLIGTLLVLDRLGSSRELIVTSHLEPILTSLRRSLAESFDITTTLKHLLSSAGVERYRNPVYQLIDEALERAEAGEDFFDALKDAFERTEVRHLGQLYRALVLIENRGTGWRKVLGDLELGVQLDLRFERERPKNAIDRIFRTPVG